MKKRSAKNAVTKDTSRETAFIRFGSQTNEGPL